MVWCHGQNECPKYFCALEPNIFRTLLFEHPVQHRDFLLDLMHFSALYKTLLARESKPREIPSYQLEILAKY